MPLCTPFSIMCWRTASVRLSPVQEQQQVEVRALLLRTFGSPVPLIHHISGCSYLSMRCQGDLLPLRGHQPQLVLVGTVLIWEGLPSALFQL